MKSASGVTGDVVFLDFNGLDFDQPIVMRPAQVNRNLWKNVLSVAPHDLADLVSPERIVICEGKPSTGGTGKDKNAEFDAFVYRTIFSTAHPETEFVSGGNTKDVIKDAIKLRAAINVIAAGASVETLIDGDHHSSSELAEIRKTGQRILSRYSIENYLWSDEILRKLAATTGDP